MVFAVLLGMSLKCYAAQPYVFKGHAFGSNIAEFPNYSDSCTSNDAWALGYKTCRDLDNKIGDLELSTIQYVYLNDKLVRVKLQERRYDTGGRFPYESNILITDLEKVIGARFPQLANEPFRVDVDKEESDDKVTFKGKAVHGTKVKTVKMKTDGVIVKLYRFYGDANRVSVYISSKDFFKELSKAKAAGKNLERKAATDRDAAANAKALKDL